MAVLATMTAVRTARKRAATRTPSRRREGLCARARPVLGLWRRRAAECALVAAAASGGLPSSRKATRRCPSLR